MIKRRMTLLAAAFAVVGPTVFAPSAFGAFSAPVDVAPTPPTANPQVATDADGDAALAWEFSAGRLQARTLSTAGALGTLQELGSPSGTTDFGPEVATDRAGNSVYVWARSQPTASIIARRLSATGALSGIIPLTPNLVGPFTDPQVATDRNGDTVFTWVNRSSSQPRVQARTMTASGALGRIRNVSPQGFTSSEPQVATDRTGESVVTWTREDGIDGDGDIIQARQLSVNGSLGPVKDLSDPAGRAFAPQVATMPDGTTTMFTWLRFDGNRDRAQGRTMSDTGTLGTTFTLTPSGPSARDPEVTIDATGDALFTWQRFEGTDDRAQFRSRSAAGTLGAVTNLSATGGDAHAPHVSQRDDGSGVFVWLRFDGANDIVQARSISAAGSLGSIQSLSAVGADARAPQVSIGSTSGQAVATWERAGVIQASRGP